MINFIIAILPLFALPAHAQGACANACTSLSYDQTSVEWFYPEGRTVWERSDICTFPRVRVVSEPGQAVCLPDNSGWPFWRLTCLMYGKPVSELMNPGTTGWVGATLCPFEQSPTFLPDTDNDTIFEPFDNCPTVANVAQTDCDSDGCGNVCDADFDNNGAVGGSDFLSFARKFGQNSCVHDIGLPGPDGEVSGDDFLRFGMLWGKYACPKENLK